MIARYLQAVSVIFIRYSAWSFSNLSKLKDIQDNNMFEDERIFNQYFKGGTHHYISGLTEQLVT
jgi:hypothetical protein